MLSAHAGDEEDFSSEDLRQQGNYQFSEHNYEHAVSMYTAALEKAASGTTAAPPSPDDSVDAAVVDTLIVLLCNRSAAFYCMGQFETAKEDAQRAWEDLSQGTHVKAAYRLAKTQLALSECDSAKQTIQQALAFLDKSDAPDDVESKEQVAAQRKSLQDLWNQIVEEALRDKDKVEVSIKAVKRPVSIKEFTIGKELGFGNFSEIHVVTHKQTHEEFALKRIPKKQAADLAKRQHPNVYNEIQMERRVLLERLPPTSPFIIRMYHAFQDYTHLYYLMDLHTQWSDLWSELKHQKKLVGCHRSQARFWLYQLVDALEHMHSHGIVHRDMKPENILLTGRGHVMVIDFGTAKDLLQTDLNGPEFVGTPDFMSPEAVEGNVTTLEGIPVPPGQTKKDIKDEGAGAAADLWALGGIAYILQTGQTPFWSPSPYLAFLRIKRGLVTRHLGIVDDNAWEFIQCLLKVPPSQRLGADVYQLHVGSDGTRTMHKKEGGYQILKDHPYFAPLRERPETMDETPLPSLRDLCVRAVAQAAYDCAQDVELCDQHPPGDGSAHDMTRLSPRDRDTVLHILYRLQYFRDYPRLFDRFFTDPVHSRLMGRVRPSTREVLGLTQMNDDQGKPPHALMNDPHEKPVAVGDTVFVCLSNPIFNGREAEDEATRKTWRKALKRAIATINRQRPKMVVVVGSNIQASEQKLLCRISDSVPVVCHDGSAFFTFWLRGVQCLALSSNADFSEKSDQLAFVREQLEMVRLSKHPLFVFVNSDPHQLRDRILKRLARGRTLNIFGPGESSNLRTTVKYTANEEVLNDETNEATSVKSTDSEEEEDRDNFSTNIDALGKFGLQWITVEPEPDHWNTEFEAFELDQ